AKQRAVGGEQHKQEKARRGEHPQPHLQPDLLKLDHIFEKEEQDDLVWAAAGRLGVGVEAADAAEPRTGPTTSTPTARSRHLQKRRKRRRQPSCRPGPGHSRERSAPSSSWESASGGPGGALGLDPFVVLAPLKRNSGRA